MTIELPQELDHAIKQLATLRGLSPDAYVREVVERQVHDSADASRPLKSMLGFWEQHNVSLSADDIDENRRDMLRGSAFYPEAQ